MKRTGADRHIFWRVLLVVQVLLVVAFTVSLLHVLGEVWDAIDQHGIAPLAERIWYGPDAGR